MPGGCSLAQGPPRTGPHTETLPSGQEPGSRRGAHSGALPSGQQLQPDHSAGGALLTVNPAHIASGTASGTARSDPQGLLRWLAAPVEFCSKFNSAGLAFKTLQRLLQLGEQSSIGHSGAGRGVPGWRAHPGPPPSASPAGGPTPARACHPWHRTGGGGGSTGGTPRVVPRGVLPYVPSGCSGQQQLAPRTRPASVRGRGSQVRAATRDAPSHRWSVAGAASSPPPTTSPPTRAVRSPLHLPDCRERSHPAGRQLLTPASRGRATTGGRPPQP